MAEPSPSGPDKRELSRVERGCVETPLFFVVGVVAMFICSLLSNLVGDWIMFAWFVVFIVAVSWRWHGPWTAVLAIIIAGGGWMLLFGLPGR